MAFRKASSAQIVPLQPVGLAKIEPSIVRLGVGLECSQIGCDGFVNPTDIPECDAKVSEKDTAIGAPSQSLLDAIDRGHMIPVGHLDETEQMQCIGLFGAYLEHLLIERLGFGQFPLLLQRDPFVEQGDDIFGGREGVHSISLIQGG